jgi:hypothetical protein
MRNFDLIIYKEIWLGGYKISQKIVDMKWLNNKCCFSKGNNAFSFGVKQSNKKAFQLLGAEGEYKMILQNDAKYLPTYTA